MATVAEIQQLYNLGRFQEAMDAARKEITACPRDDPEIPELWVILSWCHYRYKEYGVVRSCLGEAGDTERAHELWATLAAYVDKDDDRLREIAQRFPKSIAIQNALVIRARDADSVLTHAEVGSIILSFSGDGVAVANINHNGGRFFIAKSRWNTDLLIAVGMLERALRLYGMEYHWHHRAAATHWLSVAHERLGETEEDARARTRARELWERAVESDPQNTGFLQNLENARKREAELVS